MRGLGKQAQYPSRAGPPSAHAQAILDRVTTLTDVIVVNEPFERWWSFSAAHAAHRWAGPALRFIRMVPGDRRTYLGQFVVRDLRIMSPRLGSSRGFSNVLTWAYDLR